MLKSVCGVLTNRGIILFCMSFGASLRAFLMFSYQKMPYENYIMKNSSEYIYKIENLAINFSHSILNALLQV